MKDNYGAQYEANYYQHGCGQDYNDRGCWSVVFKEKAQKIVDIFNPRTFLDVGCAYGYLVEALRDLGVEAYGVDVSQYAIGQVRADIRPYCFVADASQKLPDALPARFDCISTIEVIEHLYEEDAQPFLHTLCTRTDCVIFSSTPDDTAESTHLNVQQPEYWAKRFAIEGFLRDFGQDMTFISPQAMAFGRQEKGALRLVEDYERAIRCQRDSDHKKLEETLLDKEKCMEQLRRDDEEKLARCAEQLEEERKAFQTYQNGQSETIQQILEAAYKEQNRERNRAGRIQLERETLQKKIDALEAALAGARAHEQQLQSVHDAIVHSTSWKMTWPIRRAVSGVRKLKHGGNAQASAPISLPQVSVSSESASNSLGIPAGEYAERLYRNTQPIAAIYSAENVYRLNLVTDSIEASHLLGGVATALILATEFAIRNHMTLRLITRDVPVEPSDYLNILKLNGYQPPERVEYYSDHDRDNAGQKATKLPVAEGDVFMATSWWSAQAISHTSLRKRFYYIIQEVETFFYPYGDERLMCSRVMENPNIDFIVNSHYLWDYFCKEEPNIVAHGVYFEPAFTKALYHTPKFLPRKRYKLFFYARPNNPRNLFAHGVALLDMAIRIGILNTEEWDICCAGQNMPDIVFCDGTRPIHMGQMTWQDYRDFAAQVDLALCLMCTPHPSYPPFDIAVSGGVVVTNTFLNKTDFPYCRNVLMSELNPDKFMEAMRAGVALAQNMEKRAENYAQMTIPRSWAEVLETTLTKMGEWL